MLRLGKLRGLGGDERGVSVIELGLVAPVVALFIAGIIDLSQGLAQRFAMQQAVNRSLELLLVEPLEEDVGEDQVDYDHIVAQAATAWCRWTGLDDPSEVMRAAVEPLLARPDLEP